jgi:hypothetical protein
MIHTGYNTQHTRDEGKNAPLTCKMSKQAAEFSHEEKEGGQDKK